MRRRYVTSVLAIGLAAAAYIRLARPRQLRWGATDLESDRRLPGDALIANPDLIATRAITVSTSAEQVWPWIAQLGQGQGGFYSYDALENLVGCHIHSADRIVAEWQDVGVGGQVKLHPEVRVGSPGGISPPGSHGTERDSLLSLRSCRLDHHGVPDPRPVGEVAGELRGDAVPGCAGLPVGT
jgi:hypothetical protein